MKELKKLEKNIISSIKILKKIKISNTLTFPLLKKNNNNNNILIDKRTKLNKKAK